MMEETEKRTEVKILIADDEMIVAEDLALTLQDLGYQVAGMASTGEEAIQLAKESEPGLILMDIKLAGDMDGIEASEQIRAQFDIPVIFVTAYDEKEVLCRAKQTQPYGFLTKPFSNHILRITIETALYKHAADRRVRESEERYRLLFDNMLDGFAYCKMLFEAGRPQDFVYLHVNEAFERLTGLKNVVGRKVTEVIPGIRESNPELFEIYGRVSSTGIPEKLEAYVDSLGMWFSISVYGTEGQHFVAVFDNITDRKRAEEALQQSETRFRAIFLGASEGILVADQLTTQFKYANPAICDMLGYTEDELLALTASDIHPKDKLDYALGEFQAIVRRERSKSYEIPCLRKDGTIFHADIGVSFTTIGRSQCIVGFFSDITKRKLAEEKLRESEERYRTVADFTYDWEYWIDAEDKLAYVSPSCERITGYTTQEFLDDPGLLGTIIHPDDRNDVLNHFHVARKIDFEPSYNVDFRIIRQDGQTRWINHVCRPVYGQAGQPLGRRASNRDITDRKDLEQQFVQAQKMESIGTLAGGIAHDFNNLLQVTLGYSELLLADKSEKDWDYADLQTIHQAARNGAELVRSLLTFSRKVEPKFMPLDLNQYVRETRKLLGRTIPKMIDIDLELAEDLERTNADPVQIEQIIMNLAVNAKDAMGEEGILTIRTENVALDGEYCRFNTEAKPGDYVLLSVSDSGHGMDKETLQRVFEPFYTTKDLGRGTGLGLAMVYGIVKQHGGHITCHREVGHGTTFKLYFPVTPSIEEPAVEDKGIMPALGTETVLLADDEEFVRDLGERILTRSGYTVLTAINGEEALDVYSREKGRISLVILDLIMPTLGGKECLKKILAINPQAKILVASGYAADASTKGCVQMGAKGFVPKPFRFKELLRQVRETLDESQ